MFGLPLPSVEAQASRLASKPLRPADRAIIGSAVRHDGRGAAARTAVTYGLVLTKLKRKVNNNN